MDSTSETLSMTKSHWILLVVTPIAVMISMLLPHSFNSFIAEYRTEKSPESLTVLDMKTVIVSFLTHILMFVVLPLYERFPKYYQVYSLVGYLLISTSCFASSQIGRQEDYLFLTYSAIYGIGGGIVLSVYHKSIADYFPREHGNHLVATCVHFLGFPFATLFGNPLNAYMIERFGLEATYIFLGIFTLSCGTVVSLLLKPVQNKGLLSCCSNEVGENQRLVKAGDQSLDHDVKELQNQEGGTEMFTPQIKSQWRDIFNTPQLYPWCLGKYLNYASWFALKTNLTTYFLFYLKFSFQVSASLMISFAAFQVIIGVLVVFFGVYCSNYLIHIHIVSSLFLSGLLFIWVHVVSSPLSGYVMSFLVGGLIQVNLNFGYNGASEVTNCVLSRVWSVTLVACALGILSSPLFGGVILDMTNKPWFFFTVNAFSYLFSAVLHGITWILMKRQSSGQ